MNKELHRELENLTNRQLIDMVQDLQDRLTKTSLAALSIDGQSHENYMENLHLKAEVKRLRMCYDVARHEREALMDAQRQLRDILDKYNSVSVFKVAKIKAEADAKRDEE